MILDTGVCSVFRLSQAEVPSGYMPTLSWKLIGKSWYKELSFSTRPKWESSDREETQTDQRIRVMQMRHLRKEDRVVLADIGEDEFGQDGGRTVYSITRAWHGQDDDSPAPITDLDLQEVSP